MKRWHIARTSFGLVAETTDGKRLEHLGESDHCLACAYTRLILKHGGDCDMRGLARYEYCYPTLAVIVRGQRNPIKD